MIRTILLAGTATALLAFPAAASPDKAGAAVTSAAPDLPSKAAPAAAAATDTAAQAPSPNAAPRAGVASTGTQDKTARGAADVLPDTRASGQGIEKGSASTEKSAAATGTATNIAATMSDLKKGTVIRDSAGLELGTVVKVDQGKAGAEAMVTLSADGKTTSVPLSKLSVSGSTVISSASKAEIWGTPK